jgi:hypothetical protein
MKMEETRRMMKAPHGLQREDKGRAYRVTPNGIWHLSSIMCSADISYDIFYRLHPDQ